MTLRARLLRSTSGAAAAEMALCLPMVMALMFGSFEGGNYLMTEHKVVRGVRDGARYAGRLDFSNYTCSTSSTTPTEGTVSSDATTKIRAVTRTGQISGGMSRVRGWQDSQIQVRVFCSTSHSEGIYKDLKKSVFVQVWSNRVPYPSLLGSLGFNTTGAVVQAQAQAAVMGL